MSKLSPRARAAQAECSDLTPADLPTDSVDYFMLVELPNGELPAVRQFSTADGLAERMQSLIGSDVFLIPLYGKYLPYSLQYLFVNDGDALLLSTVGKPKRVEVYLDEVELQEDNYVGPPEMINGSFDESPYVEDEVEDELAGDEFGEEFDEEFDDEEEDFED